MEEERDTSLDVRPGLVRSYMKHVIVINGSPVNHIFAVVKWYKKSPHGFCSKQFVNQGRGKSSFLPIQRVASRFIPVNVHGHAGHMKVLPLPRKIYELV